MCSRSLTSQCDISCGQDGQKRPETRRYVVITHQCGSLEWHINRSLENTADLIVFKFLITFHRALWATMFFL